MHPILQGVAMWKEIQDEVKMNCFGGKRFNCDQTRSDPLVPNRSSVFLSLCTRASTELGEEIGGEY